MKRILYLLAVAVCFISCAKKKPLILVGSWKGYFVTTGNFDGVAYHDTSSYVVEISQTDDNVLLGKTISTEGKRKATAEANAIGNYDPGSGRIFINEIAPFRSSDTTYGVCAMYLILEYKRSKDTEELLGNFSGNCSAKGTVYLRKEIP